MKVLVTGATGFIGRQAIDLLVQAGADVTGTSRSPMRLAGADHIAANLIEPGMAVALIDQVRPTHLLHLAWNAVPGKFWAAADNLDWCVASVALIRAFHANGGERAVMAGSCAEYAWTGTGLLEEDLSSIDPATLYGVAKDALRRLVLHDADQHGHSVAWGRLFWLYGPGEARGRLVSDVAAALCADQPAEVSEGTQRRDFMHVTDAAGAFIAALQSDYRGVFNICSGEAVAVRDVVRILAEEMEQPENVHYGARPGNPNEPDLLYGAVERLRHVIGYSPIFSLRDGLRNTVQKLRKNANSGS